MSESYPIELNYESSMGLAPISKIRANLDRLFPNNEWINWELETLSLELSSIFDELTRDKLNVLKLIVQDPDLFYTNSNFFLHAVKVMNNMVTDFDSLPMPNSLELAYGIIEAGKLGLKMPKLDHEDSHIVELISYLLRQEGYSEPVQPFGFIPNDLLVQGQSPEDTEAKKNAIKIYVETMSKL